MATITEADSTVHSFITLGASETPKQQVELVRRENADGVELQRLGTAGEPMRYVGLADLDVDTPYSTNLKIALDLFRSLQAKTVTVVDDHGIETLGMAILKVRIPPTYGGHPNPRKIANNAGGLEGVAATHFVAVEFTMVDTN